LNKILFVFLGISFAAGAGCVSIHQEVPVYAPEPMDAYNRSPLDKCTPHVYPHRLVLAQAGSSSPLIQNGGVYVNDQQSFNFWWSTITPQLDTSRTLSNALQPLVDWDHETVSFMPIMIDNSCEKAKPYAEEMTTDCYTITFPIFRYNEGVDCGTPVQFPVFIYIFPKTVIPGGVQWIYSTSTPGFVPTATASPTPIVTPTPTPESEDE